MNIKTILNLTIFFIVPSHLFSQETIPTEPKISFSHKAGFYEDAFYLTLSAPDESYTIAYTIDCSNPVYSPTRFITANNTTIFIHPDTSYLRGKTPAFVVRASLIKEGYLPSFPVSATYIFPEKVKTQAYPGGKWPNGSVNGQKMDYIMNPSVVNSNNSTMEAALTEIPSISISIDPDSLFNTSKGIYVNAYQRGINWERNCSAELIFPDGSTGFQVNGGLRIRGGDSRQSANPKHSLRLFFRKEYGAGKLEFPLFGDEGAYEFDKVDLRTEQNYSYNKDREQNIHNSFIREIFSRDSHRDMGQPYSRGRFYHLYLNGMYWGIYQTDERTDASYAEEYFGDDKEDYDVIKVSPDYFPYTNEVTDGNDDAWKELWDYSEIGFSSNEDYFSLEGKNAAGISVKGTNVLVDIDNLIDYMLLIFYTGNFDAPVSAFWGNKMPNNYYAVYNRKDRSKGFVFLAHDSEHSLMKDKVYVGNGLYENRVNIADLTGWYQMDVTEYINFHPQWLHYKLSNIKEYRVRFANRAYWYLFANGVLSPDSSIQRLKTRINQIDTAIIAESARWGDVYSTISRTKENAWLPEINVLLNEVLTVRTDITIEQLIEADLYPPLNTPIVSSGYEKIVTDYQYFEEPFSVLVTNLDNRGIIYYTIDGSDPRLIGGKNSDSAIQIENGASLSISSSTVFKTRIKDGVSWSALREINFMKNKEDYSNLKITEIHYHPENVILGADTIDDKDLEFLELKNIGDAAINLSGLKIDSAINFSFPENSILAPKEFFVVASKPAKFYNQYGRSPSGNYSGNLSNSGEYILLTDAAGNEIFSLTYDDKQPWPEEADGNGFSLAANEINPAGNPSSTDYWRKSYVKGGSPFSDDLPPSSIEDSSISEIKIYPNPAKTFVIIENHDTETLSWTIELTDHMGRMIFKTDCNEKSYRLDLVSQNVPYGIYFVRLYTKQGNKVVKLLYIP